MLFSVIIPVYNVEAYLEECVNSVIAQTYKEMEIILVDDGSSDSSGSLCDELSKLDNRIRVIHKKNGGLSDARNAGLKVSNGDYVLFLDSDDYWNGDFLFDIANKIRKNPKLDFITADGYVGIFPQGKRIPNLCHFQEDSFVYQNGEKFLEFVFTYKSKEHVDWGWSAWRNIYRAALLKENNLYFKIGIINEDAEWTPRVILASKHFDFYEKPYYMYRLSRPGSITKISTAKTVLDYLETVNNWIDYSDNLSNKKLALIIKERFSNNLFVYLTYIYSFDKNTRKKIFEVLKQSNFQDYVTIPKYRKMVKSIQSKGYPKTCRKMYMKFLARLILKKIALKLNLIDR